MTCPGCYSYPMLLNLHSGHTSSATGWSINDSVQEQGVIQRFLGSCGLCRGLNSQESRDREKPECGSRVFSQPVISGELSVALGRHLVGHPEQCLLYTSLCKGDGQWQGAA